ncbi:MAG: polynucleotide adenylyltransferase PcnB [Pseudomonadales bacterium]|nr:polynucleotide adenylyltransferase PcnB [Pseudomonadales bacterium]
MKPIIISAKEHGISRQEISPNAIKVIETLHQAGFKAYLVGGGIRDLLLGLHPKDFDISSNARPEQLIKLFRKARIIGRRFRIVHVYFGREIIEVTTFRGHHPETDEEHPHAVTSETGQLLRDNIYGSVEEDAIRRDFTINSLYYDLENNSLLDYTGAYNDIKQRQLRTIGDPIQRFREDPVRILRALRFAAKLNFSIDKESEQSILMLSDLLNHIPAARLFDEFLKLLLSGYGQKTFALMRQYQVFEHLFPLTNGHLKYDYEQRFITLALQNTDLRIAQNKGITPAFLLAVLLWPPLQSRSKVLIAQGISPVMAMQQAGQQIISEQLRRTSIPRRFSMPMRDIWYLQLRLDKRSGQRAEKLLSHPRFRAAYDFLLLREQCGEPSPELQIGLGEWWTNYQQSDSAARKNMTKGLEQRKTPRQGRRRRR